MSQQNKRAPDVNTIVFYAGACLFVLVGLYLYRPPDLYFLADDFIHIPEAKTT
jgi:hypothetical protein